MAELRPPESKPLSDSATKNQDFWDLSAEAMFRGAPSWLLSVIVHVGILIILALVFLPSKTTLQLVLDTKVYEEENEGEQLKFLSPDTAKNTDQEPIKTPENLPETEDPLAKPPNPIANLSRTTTPHSIDTTTIGLALKGRTAGMKKVLLELYGGNATTESAVQGGLRWLAKNQQRDGSWSLKGPYLHGSNMENREAATSMALLAFLGAGHTHRSNSEFSKNVSQGIKWLLNRQDSSGCFYHEGSINSRFYTQAQATIAVCELYAISYDTKLRGPAEMAVNYLVTTQSPKGGWRYYPQGNSDVSVTGWVAMALQSARMAALNVPNSSLQRIGPFLDTTASEMGSRYSYMPGRRATPSMTAEALLCRQYLGWARNDERLLRGVDWILMPENLINYETNPNVYYWYYATQVTHHMGGKIWDRWNAVMRQEVPRHQVKAGREAGSWTPSNRNHYDLTGGRLYVTCLSIYMLEVYYRHLPIYRHTVIDGNQVHERSER